MTVCTENYIRATGDEGRLESDVTGGCLCAEWGDAPARLCPAGDGFVHCSKPGRYTAQMRLAKHDDVIQPFAANKSNQSLSKTVPHGDRSAIDLSRMPMARAGGLRSRFMILPTIG